MYMIHTYYLGVLTADPWSCTDCPVFCENASNALLQALAKPVLPDVYGYNEAASRAVLETYSIAWEVD